MVEVHVLASGSDGNCTVIEHGGEAVMIDAGISCKRIQAQADMLKVDLSTVKAVVLTHEHDDHINGLGPLCRKLDIPLRANEATFCASQPKIGDVQFWPFQSNDDFDVGQFHFVPLPTYHDAVEPNGFYITVADKRILYVTDTGHFSFQVQEALRHADMALVETNYDRRMLIEGPYPPPLKQRISDRSRGHMCNDETAKELEANLNLNADLFLMHLSRNNNTTDKARGAVEDRLGRRHMDCLELPKIKNDCRSIRV